MRATDQDQSLALLTAWSIVGCCLVCSMLGHQAISASIATMLCGGNGRNHHRLCRAPREYSFKPDLTCAEQPEMQ